MGSCSIIESCAFVGVRVFLRIATCFEDICATFRFAMEWLQNINSSFLVLLNNLFKALLSCLLTGTIRWVRKKLLLTVVKVRK